MTTDTTAPAGQPSGPTEEEPAPQPLRQVVARRVGTLQKGYQEDIPWAVGALARLRRGAGKLPEDCPDLWGLGVDLADCTYAQLPGEKPERADHRAETAVHVALSLYALHQQSRREQGMHQGTATLPPPEGGRSAGRSVERSLGWAVRELMPRGEVDEALRRRFVQAGTAPGIGVLAYRLRGIVQLLRRDGVALDYGLLAGHLLTAQCPGGMREVRSAWGQGYALYRSPKSDTPTDPASDSPGGDEPPATTDDQ